MTSSKLIIDPVAGRIDRLFDGGTFRSNVGCLGSHGYLHIRTGPFIGGSNLLVHRMIWEYVNGPIPKDMVIDHINGIKTDNRICNLRLVTVSQNQENRLHAQVDNLTSGLKGVWFHKERKKWVAEIRKNGQKYYLGLFVTKDDAKKAYNDAAATLHTINPHATK